MCSMVKFISCNGTVTLRISYRKNEKGVFFFLRWILYAFFLHLRTKPIIAVPKLLLIPMIYMSFVYLWPFYTLSYTMFFTIQLHTFVAGRLCFSPLSTAFRENDENHTLIYESYQQDAASLCKI